MSAIEFAGFLSVTLVAMDLAVWGFVALLRLFGNVT